jgi:hypothetical protein
MVAGFVPAATRAGTVLLSRDSTIAATGTDGVSDFNLIDGSKDFNGFSDAVDTTDAGVAGPHVAANQHSRPAMDDQSGFTGAFAEGSVSADGVDGAAEVNEAVSNFDLKFQVLGAPSLVSFGGSVGVSGGGTTSVALSNESTGEILLSKELIPGEDGQEIQHSSVLQPGVYELSVAASLNSAKSDSMAYYTLSLSISPVSDQAGGSDGPAAIPLPPAVFSAASMFGVGGVLYGLQSYRRRRHA